MRIQQFDYSVDILQTIIRQINNSTNILGLITLKQAWYNVNQTQFWSDWFDNVFNLLTANEFGLSVWSRILNVPYYVNDDPDFENKFTFGFNEIIDGDYTNLENTNTNFGNGNFFYQTLGYTLTSEEQRFFLRLIFYKYNTRCAVTSLNSFLNYLVSTSDIGYGGKITVLDGLDMTMTYVFSWPTFSQNLLQAIIDNDAFPRSCGVGIKFYVETDSIFGFGEFYQNFNNGNCPPQD